MLLETLREFKSNSIISVKKQQMHYSVQTPLNRFSFLSKCCISLKSCILYSKGLNEKRLHFLTFKDIQSPFLLGFPSFWRFTVFDNYSIYSVRFTSEGSR